MIYGCFVNSSARGAFSLRVVVVVVGSWWFNVITGRLLVVVVLSVLSQCLNDSRNPVDKGLLPRPEILLIDLQFSPPPS